MRILQTSDTHIGLTTKGQINVMLRKAVKEDFDVIVHCGDWSGGTLGYKKVIETLKLFRAVFPDKPFVATIGNHDYWCEPVKRKKTVDAITGRETYRKRGIGPDDYTFNLQKIEEAFREYKVHFLDKDGVFVHPDFRYHPIVGVCGWYNNPNPPTNDRKFLPIGLGGDTNRFILKDNEDRLFQHLDTLKEFDKTTDELIFVSHFPLIKLPGDRLFDELSGRVSLGEYLKTEFDCKYFLNGHAHQLHKGPLRYECGSDYFNPKYQIIEV